MSMIEEVRKKVQRILTDDLGRVEIDRDGDFVLHHESAVVFVSLREMSDKPDANIVINAFCPMVINVPLTPEVYKWVATEGQHYFFGHCQIFENENGTQLWYRTQKDTPCNPGAGTLRIDGLVRGSLCLVAVRSKHFFGPLASP
jgi:hypothetical protein